MRLIDADNLIPIMKYTTTDNEIGVFPIRIGFDAIKGVIDDAPTIGAIEVVRCKDCRWFKQDSSPVGYGYCDGRMVGREVDYNDFCSYGERLCNYFGERREP